MMQGYPTRLSSSALWRSWRGNEMDCASGWMMIGQGRVELTFLNLAGSIADASPLRCVWTKRYRTSIKIPNSFFRVRSWMDQELHLSCWIEVNVTYVDIWKLRKRFGIETTGRLDGAIRIFILQNSRYFWTNIGSKILYLADLDPISDGYEELWCS